MSDRRRRGGLRTLIGSGLLRRERLELRVFHGVGRASSHSCRDPAFTTWVGLVRADVSERRESGLGLCRWSDVAARLARRAGPSGKSTDPADSPVRFQLLRAWSPKRTGRPCPSPRSMGDRKSRPRSRKHKLPRGPVFLHESRPWSPALSPFRAIWSHTFFGCWTFVRPIKSHSFGGSWRSIV